MLKQYGMYQFLDALSPKTAKYMCTYTYINIKQALVPVVVWLSKANSSILSEKNVLVHFIYSLFYVETQWTLSSHYVSLIDSPKQAICNNTVFSEGMVKQFACTFVTCSSPYARNGPTTCCYFRRRRSTSQGCQRQDTWCW